MSFFPRGVFIYCLAGIVLTGSFSRFTHGKYTPQFYAYQEYHQKDDGSSTAWIVPVIDVVLGSLLFVPRTRLLAAIIITAFFGVGIGLQMKAGKSFEIDIFTFIIGVLAAVEAARTRRS